MLFLYCVGLYGLVLASNAAVNLLGHQYYEQSPKGGIFDIVHETLPDVPDEVLFNNVIPLALTAYVLITPNSGKLVRTFASKLFLILLLRSLTSISTILPKYEKCSISLENFSWFFNGGCYEKVFSAHTSFVYLLLMCLMDSGHISFFTAAALLGIELFLIALTRSHYTVDILIGLMITFFVYESPYGMFQDF